MEQYKRKAIFDTLSKHCHHADKGDYIEVCEWNNGEGFDVSITDKQFSLTWGEFEALQKMVVVLEHT